MNHCSHFSHNELKSGRALDTEYAGLKGKYQKQQGIVLSRHRGCRNQSVGDG
jgi:hypothetical protein